MKDGQKLHTPKTTPSFTNTRGLARKRRSLTDSNIRPVIDGVDINRISSQGNTTLKNLRLFLIEPDMQGFYSCAVEDKVGHVIESRRAFVRLKGKCY